MSKEDWVGIPQFSKFLNAALYHAHQAGEAGASVADVIKGVSRQTGEYLNIANISKEMKKAAETGFLEISGGSGKNGDPVKYRVPEQLSSESRALLEDEIARLESTAAALHRSLGE